MAANKKRKLDCSGGSTPPSTMMSAYALRQQLFPSATPVVEKPLEPAPEDVPQPRRSETPSTRPIASRSSSKPNSVEEDGPDSNGATVRQHSSFRPSKKNLQRKAGGRIVLATPEPERLVILGSYGVKVREGEATIAGAVLSPVDDIQWVHAPHCHALPVLRTTDDTVLELHPHPAARGLRELARLNPVFGKLWNETPSHEAESGRASKTSGTFQIIYTSEDGPQRAVLQELVSPAEWNKKLSQLVTARRNATPIIFLCGPKSSGKSTFGRLLANRLITDRAGSKNKPWSSVMVMDLDPGQPEYSPPGVISLSKVSTPNLSPSFCHPALDDPAGYQIRAHAIASVTPAQDPSHFLECALDLFAHYQRGPDAKWPLVINTPGWIQGTGLDILTDLISAIRPTEVIYMSQDGPEETTTSLQSACNDNNLVASGSNSPIPFSTLPSQPSDISSRTSLHLRTMQAMSYFHLHHPPQQRDQPPLPPPWRWEWNPTPLSHLRPWRVRYTGGSSSSSSGGSQRGFLGILCYDHQPAPALLAEAINGTVLALARLESRAALRDLLLPLPLPLPSADLYHHPDDDDDDDHESQSKSRSRALLPLIPNPLGRTLDPRHSRLLGLVLVRGVDAARGELQLLTPGSTTIPGEDGIGGGGGGGGAEELVLVAGRFDTPSWAYAEDLYLGRWRRRGGNGGGGEMKGSGGREDGDDDYDDDDDDDQVDEQEVGEAMGLGREEVPWVEVLHGSQKRAVGSKVWRVRRDLGRG
ncbi:hypothetical protein VTK56DRAFT_1436 [Thermocarpiscus australiensis]